MNFIASYVDAWIKIVCNVGKRMLRIIASYVDAWIKMQSSLGFCFDLSHPMWMRGLKKTICS